MTTFRYDDLMVMTDDHLRKWYEDNESALGAIEGRLINDISDFLNISGKLKGYICSIRIKAPASFVEKWKKYKETLFVQDDFKKKWQNQRQIRPCDWIRDLVGARITCLFEDDQYNIINFFRDYPLFDLIDHEHYSNYHAVSFVDNKSPTIKKDKKYEGIHLTVQYNSEFIRKPDSTSEPIYYFPFEVQIRTMMQHAWAEAEHMLNYKLEMKKELNEETRMFIEKGFLNLKEHLDACEKHLYSIKDTLPERSINLQKTTVSIPMPPDIPTPFSASMKKIEKLYYKALKQPTNQAKFYLLAISELKKIIDRLSKTKDDITFKKGYSNNEIIWKMQTELLLNFGYLLTVAGEKDIYNKLQSLFRQIGLNNSKYDLSGVEIYEKIRLNDKENKIPTDALTLYRCAGAYISEQRNFRMAKRRMLGALELYQSQNQQNNELINNMHLKRRLSEYSFNNFYRSLLRDYDEFNDALRYAKEAFTEEDAPSGLVREKRKILSSIMMYIFYQFYRNGDEIGFRREYHPYDTEMEQLYDRHIDNLKEKGHALQAYAIYLFCHKHKEQEAIELMRKAKEIIERKATNPIHLKIARDILDYMIFRHHDASRKPLQKKLPKNSKLSRKGRKETKR